MTGNWDSKSMIACLVDWHTRFLLTSLKAENRHTETLHVTVGKNILQAVVSEDTTTEDSEARSTQEKKVP